MKYRRGYHKKDGTYVQGHYVSEKSKNHKKLNKKNRLGCFLTLFTLFTTIGLFISCEELENGCEKRKCSDFNSQSEAQAYFNSNPSCSQNLDTDSDNIPCENLPK